MGERFNKTMTPAALAANRANVADIAARRRAQTHCHAGHEFTLENTIWKSDGCRNCRQCHTDREFYKRLERRLDRIAEEARG